MNDDTSSRWRSWLARRNSWRWLLPVILVLFVLAIVIWLPLQLRQFETNERQEQLIADTLWVEQALQFQLLRNEGSMRLVGAEIANGQLPQKEVQARLRELLNKIYEFESLEWLDANGKIIRTDDVVNAAATNQDSINKPQAPSSFTQKNPLLAVAERARRTGIAQFAPPRLALGPNEQMLMDFYLPLFDGTNWLGTLRASYDLNKLLEGSTPWWFAQEHQISLLDTDDRLLAQRAALGPGRGIYTHNRALELPGQTVILRTNSVKGAPSLVPKILVGSVIALALGLIWSLWTLWRHVARRLAAESALRQQMSFRTAMENSLVTGMRARDLEGRVTYVNPAFCQIVGYEEQELLGKLPPMPYWAPEAMNDYQERFAQVLAGTITPQGFETIFQRADGARIPVLIFESPLLDETGQQTGWMGSILDISDRKRVEELNRQQQEKLQTSARLATMGEISSMLAHELNQPLAAISSYTTGALNLLKQEQAPNPALLQSALEKASTQAQRAGQIIRSVHEFVKKREPTRTPTSVMSIIETILPLVELQAQRYFVKVETEIAENLPQMLADKTMLEQVLLNLTRNAIEAMRDVQPKRRVLRLCAKLDEHSAHGAPSLTIAVIDQGHGIAPDVAARLFSPFFSTKAEGMGMGLNICRTAIEFHGGVLQHDDAPTGGTIFTFSLPVIQQNS